jgi:CubicO group peptidase (beta-lactamase class C family)
MVDVRSRLWSIAVAACLALAAAGASSAQQVPDTPAGRQLERFLTFFNSGDVAGWQGFLAEDPKTSGDPQALMMKVGGLFRNFTRYGPLELENVTSDEPNRIEALARAQKPEVGFEWASVSIEVSDSEPHHWTDFSIELADDPSEILPEGDLTDEGIARYVDGVIDRFVARDFFSGAVLLARDGRTIYKRAAGHASKRYAVPNRTDTKFNMGSMNKMFTGVAIAQLEAQGKLSFDDLVGVHLPDYPNEQVRQTVTIHHLLTHTAGTGMYWREFFSNPAWAYLKSVQDFDALTNSRPLAFEPGERFEYSNCGPIILGLIIERISGLSYDEYIRRNVTGPAGMANTDTYDMWDPVDNLAIGYAKHGPRGEPYGRWVSNTFANPVKGGPAGGGYSTVEDLLKFDIALRNHTLVDTERLAILTTGKVERDENTRYGYLFEDTRVNGQRVVGHSGGAMGISSTLGMYLDTGWTVAIMSNYDSGMIVLRHKIRRLLTRRAPG